MPHALPQPVEGARVAGRELFFAEAARIDDWPESIDAPDPYFVLFVAADAARIADAELTIFARKLIGQGAACMSAWGPGCGRMHLAFDEADIDLNPDFGADDVIGTTDHADESLDEALWDALFVEWPAPKYEATCDSFLAISVGRDDWAAAVRRRLEDPEGLEAALGLLDG
jgi:hypothetical protein